MYVCGVPVREREREGIDHARTCCFSLIAFSAICCSHLFRPLPAPPPPLETSPPSPPRPPPPMVFDLEEAGFSADLRSGGIVFDFTCSVGVGFGSGCAGFGWILAGAGEGVGEGGMRGLEGGEEGLGGCEEGEGELIGDVFGGEEGGEYGLEEGTFGGALLLLLLFTGSRGGVYGLVEEEDGMGGGERGAGWEGGGEELGWLKREFTADLSPKDYEASGIRINKKGYQFGDKPEDWVEGASDFASTRRMRS